jgi:hypothetical protein
MQVECDAQSLPAVTCTTKGRRFGVRSPKTTRNLAEPPHVRNRIEDAVIGDRPG